MKGMNTSTLTLPEELIVEILLRLPVRSLLRFKCVCKSWLSLVSDSRFAKSHFDLAAAPTHRVVLKKINDFEMIESFDLEASLYDKSAVVRLHLPPHHHRLEIWNNSGGLPIWDPCSGLKIWGSCGGFLLLAEKDHVMIVWNPSTGTSRQIQWSKSWKNPHPPTKISTRFDRLIGKGIGYDESTEDYLIVLIGLDRPKCPKPGVPVANYWLPQLEVFSLKTNSSCFICGASEVGYDQLANDESIGLFLNHSLHWLVKSKAKEFNVVLAFNLIDRSLSEIEIPVPHDLESGDYYLTLMGGCLGLCLETGTDWRSEIKMIKIWIMKEYKVHSSWTESFVRILDDYPYELFAPTCFTRVGGVLGSTRCGRLINLNHRGEILKDHECRPHYGRLIHYGTYRESLSLPGDFANEVEETTDDEE